MLVAVAANSLEALAELLLCEVPRAELAGKQNFTLEVPILDRLNAEADKASIFAGNNS